MPVPISQRQRSIPVLYTRGTHFEVGLEMGRTFSSMIKEFVEFYKHLNQTLLPAYHTEEGKKFYDDSLETVKSSYPQYIDELQGIAKGSGVEFYKLFLLHLGDILTKCMWVRSSRRTASKMKKAGIVGPASGCLNVVLNNYHNRYIAHTQDAPICFINHVYFVVAHIVSDKPQGKYNVKEEKFMSLCYAGHLPGFTMGSNHHGIVFAINKLSPSIGCMSMMPPHFIGRALLSAEDMNQAFFMLNNGGAADGFSLTIASVNDSLRKCYIIEVAPSAIEQKGSLLNIGELKRVSFAYHSNKYLGLQVDEVPNTFGDISAERLGVLANSNPPRTKEQLLPVMNHRQIFLTRDSYPLGICTIALGIFDLNERTLEIYIDSPNESDPIIVMPLISKIDYRIFET